ncbi:MAG: DinB family protein [Caldilineaceae bacterium]
MDIHAIICSQYHAAIGMLEQAVQKCPETLWAAAEDKVKFWHIAYHGLFFVHLYLQKTVGDFAPWPKHRENYEVMGRTPWPPYEKPEIGEPYTKADIQEYIDFCRQQVDMCVPPTDMDAESGFDWLPMSKFELQIYSIRHLQQHTGELMERLGTRAGIDVDWIGMGS